MPPLKQVGLRLTQELLERVDALQSEGHDSRSESLRHLIEVGLERDHTGRRLADVEAKLERLDHVLERTHHLAFMCYRMLVKDREDFKVLVDQEMAASRTALANSLVNRFGKLD